MPNRRYLARVLSAIEAGDVEAAAALADSDERSSPTIGITGPPGAGKSTLVSSLITHLRDRGESVAVLAVDPSSPITGGALLGDRIRMQDHADDPEVFIRSMATRGHLGGLAEATGLFVKAVANSGFDHVIVETVGVGQSEVEIMNFADVVVLVVTPGWGDQIQADKAGIVEIADVFVVNKADRPGANDVKRALLDSIQDGRQVLQTTATTGDGVADLVETLIPLADGRLSGG
jgi:LAO/AO transport system kinase